jgi:hypothetical protein
MRVLRRGLSEFHLSCYVCSASMRMSCPELIVEPSVIGTRVLKKEIWKCPQDVQRFHLAEVKAQV